MKINNTESLNEIITFAPDSLYKFIVLKRGKDDEGKKNSVIKSWWVSDQDELDRFLPEMIEYCNLFKARLYVDTDRKSLTSVVFSMQKKLLDVLELMCSGNLYNINSHIKTIKKIPDSCAALAENTDKRNYTKKIWWLFDVDTKEEDTIKYVLDLINTQSADAKKIILPTKNGYHILAERIFDGKRFNQVFVEGNIPCEVKDNAMTLIYMETSE